MKKYLVVFSEGEYEDYYEMDLAVVDTRDEALLIAESIEKKEQPWFNFLMDKWIGEKYLRDPDLVPYIDIREIPYFDLYSTSADEILEHTRED